MKLPKFLYIISMASVHTGIYVPMGVAKTYEDALKYCEAKGFKDICTQSNGVMVNLDLDMKCMIEQALAI